MTARAVAAALLLSTALWAGRVGGSPDDPSGTGSASPLPGDPVAGPSDADAPARAATSPGAMVAVRSVQHVALLV